uniref:Uncharacterized protein n=1 Tax=Glossina pallidipes TaxID=7398 RepID=A0A1B0A4R1_GLOPL
MELSIKPDTGFDPGKDSNANSHKMVKGHREFHEDRSSSNIGSSNISPILTPALPFLLRALIEVGLGERNGNASANELQT